MNHMMNKRLLITALSLLLICALPAHARYAEGEQKAVEAVKRAKPSVVRIDTSHPAARNTGVGSGVVLRKDGFILTNFHVVRRARIIHVTLANGKTFTAQLWNSTPQYDLAVLKIDAQDLPVPTFGDSSRLDLGQMAIAIGCPQRFSWSITIGTISATGRKVEMPEITYRNMIQTDAAISPGSSGGALVNSTGEVIGINTLVYTGTNANHNAQGLGFAIAINDALKIAQSLVGRTRIAAPKSSGGPWIGLSGKDVTSDMADMWDFKVKSGVLVTAVTESGPAASAGIKRNDVITEVGGTPVRTFKDLTQALSNRKPGDTLELIVWANGKARRAVTLKIEATAR